MSDFCRKQKGDCNDSFFLGESIIVIEDKLVDIITNRLLLNLCKRNMFSLYIHELLCKRKTKPAVAIAFYSLLSNFVTI